MTDDTLRSVDLTRIGTTRYRATNPRGGEIVFGQDPDEPSLFRPVELMLAALAGCGAIDTEMITQKRAISEKLDVHAEAHKVRDEGGNHLTGMRVSFDVVFPEGEEGDAAREALSRAIQRSRDRICTVGRTIQLGAAIEYERADGVPLD